MNRAGGAPGTGARRLSRPVRVALAVVLIVAAVVLLFTVVFPWFDQQFVNDPVLGGPPPGTGAP